MMMMIMMMMMMILTTAGGSLRTGHQQMLFKISVLKYFVIFPENTCVGERLCWILFLIKLQAFKFIGNGLQRKCFTVNTEKFLRTAFFL